MADEFLASKLAAVAAAFSVRQGPDARPSEGFGARGLGNQGNAGKPRQEADEGGSWGRAPALDVGKQQGIGANARSGRPSSEHLAGLDQVKPHHVAWMFIVSGLFWAAYFGGQVVIDLMHQPHP